jgi:hypothetical protein
MLNCFTSSGLMCLDKICNEVQEKRIARQMSTYNGDGLETTTTAIADDGVETAASR